MLMNMEGRVAKLVDKDVAVGQVVEASLCDLCREVEVGYVCGTGESLAAPINGG